jgi:hypothetical protein
MIPRMLLARNFLVSAVKVHIIIGIMMEVSFSSHSSTTTA